MEWKDEDSEVWNVMAKPLLQLMKNLSSHFSQIKNWSLSRFTSLKRNEMELCSLIGDSLREYWDNILLFTSEKKSKVPQLDNPTQTHWAISFRMILEGTGKEIEEEKSHQARKALLFFLERTTEKESCESFVGESLLKYLSSHFIDPCNAFIGMTPSHRLIFETAKPQKSLAIKSVQETQFEKIQSLLTSKKRKEIKLRSALVSQKRGRSRTDNKISQFQPPSTSTSTTTSSTPLSSLLSTLPLSPKMATTASTTPPSTIPFLLSSSSSTTTTPSSSSTTTTTTTLPSPSTAKIASPLSSSIPKIRDFSSPSLTLSSPSSPLSALSLLPLSPSPSSLSPPSSSPLSPLPSSKRKAFYQKNSFPLPSYSYSCEREELFHLEELLCLWAEIDDDAFLAFQVRKWVLEKRLREKHQITGEREEKREERREEERRERNEEGERDLGGDKNLMRKEIFYAKDEEHVDQAMEALLTLRRDYAADEKYQMESDSVFETLRGTLVIIQLPETFKKSDKQLKYCFGNASLPSLLLDLRERERNEGEEEERERGERGGERGGERERKKREGLFLFGRILFGSVERERAIVSISPFEFGGKRERARWAYSLALPPVQEEETEIESMIVVEVGLQNIYPFSSYGEQIEEPKFTFVEEPLFHVYEIASKEIKWRIGSLLSQQGIPSEFLIQLFSSNNSPSFPKDIFECEYLCHQLTQMDRIASTHITEKSEWGEELTLWMNCSLLASLQALKFQRQVFFPEIGIYEDGFRKYAAQVIKCATMRYEGIRSLLRSKIGAVVQHVNEILDGTEKADLTSWWLQEIEDSVDCYLEREGLSYSLSDDYINQPLQNPLKTQKEHKLLVEILTPNKSDSHFLLQFVQELKERIYIRLNSYMNDVTAVLELFKDEISLENEDSSSQKCVKRHLSKIFTNSIKSIPTLMADLKYIQEMESLEEEFEERIKTGEQKATPLHLSHVVPISGLIFGRIMIIEQEYQTALDVWAPHLLKENLFPSPSLSSSLSSSTSLSSLSSSRFSSSPSWLSSTSFSSLSFPPQEERRDEKEREEKEGERKREEREGIVERRRSRRVSTDTLKFLEQLLSNIEEEERGEKEREGKREGERGEERENIEEDLDMQGPILRQLLNRSETSSSLLHLTVRSSRLFIENPQQLSESLNEHGHDNSSHLLPPRPSISPSSPLSSLSSLSSTTATSPLLLSPHSYSNSPISSLPSSTFPPPLSPPHSSLQPSSPSFSTPSFSSSSRRRSNSLPRSPFPPPFSSSPRNQAFLYPNKEEKQNENERKRIQTRWKEEAREVVTVGKTKTKTPSSTATTSLISRPTPTNPTSRTNKITTSLISRSTPTSPVLKPKIAPSPLASSAFPTPTSKPKLTSSRSSPSPPSPTPPPPPQTPTTSSSTTSTTRPSSSSSPTLTTTSTTSITRPPSPPSPSSTSKRPQLKYLFQIKKRPTAPSLYSSQSTLSQSLVIRSLSPPPPSPPHSSPPPPSVYQQTRETEKRITDKSFDDPITDLTTDITIKLTTDETIDETTDHFIEDFLEEQKTDKKDQTTEKEKRERIIEKSTPGRTSPPAWNVSPSLRTLASPPLSTFDPVEMPSSPKAREIFGRSGKHRERVFQEKNKK